MTPVAGDPIDLDAQGTWPEATRRWAVREAERLAGSTEHIGDLAIPLEREDEFRQTFGARKVLAYHCTRLVPHEAAAIRADGLRLLDEQLVRDRIADAVAHGALPDGARRRAETGNVYAIGNTDGRVGQICLIVGRAVFDDDPGGCEPLLGHWGGEAIRGGPADVPALAGVGVPSIVVAALDLTRRHNDPYTWPALTKLFVGTLLELRGGAASVHCRQPIPAGDVPDIWQPGHPEYDLHPALPRDAVRFGT
jgi:hypothetical protein